MLTLFKHLQAKIKLVANYLSEMKGKICGENLCCRGAFIHTQACSLCVVGCEPGQCPVHGAGTGFHAQLEAEHYDMGLLVTTGLKGGEVLVETQ